MGFFSVLGNIGKVLAAPVLGGITSAVNANQIRKENQRNRDWQEKMSDIAYQRQRDLTMESPMLQKQGLEMAGISPAAMNGYTGGTAQVSTGTPAPTSLPETFNFDPATLLQSLQVQNETKVADADVKLKDSEAALNNKQAGRYDELTDATISKIKADTDLDVAQIKEVAAHVPLLQNQSDYYNWLASQADLDYQKNAATYQSDIDRIKAQNHLSEKQAKAYVKLVDQYANAQLDLIYAQIYNARASGQAQLSQAYTARLNYQLEASFKDLKSEIMSWDIEKSKKEEYLIQRQGEEYGLNQKAMRDVQRALTRKLDMERTLAPINTATGVIGAATGVAGAVAPGPKHIGGFR